MGMLPNAHVRGALLTREDPVCPELPPEPGTDTISLHWRPAGVIPSGQSMPPVDSAFTGDASATSTVETANPARIFLSMCL